MSDMSQISTNGNYWCNIQIVHSCLAMCYWVVSKHVNKDNVERNDIQTDDPYFSPIHWLLIRVKCDNFEIPYKWHIRLTLWHEWNLSAINVSFSNLIIKLERSFVCVIVLCDNFWMKSTILLNFLIIRLKAFDLRSVILKYHAFGTLQIISQYVEM